MNSANDAVNALHAAFLAAAGLDERELPMNACYERLYAEALKWGITPDHVKIGYKLVMKYNRTAQHGFQRGTSPLHMFNGEDRLGLLLYEVAKYRAEQRARVDAGKADVLRATGREVRTLQDPKLAKECLAKLADGLKGSLQ